MYARTKISQHKAVKKYIVTGQNTLEYIHFSSENTDAHYVSE